MKLTLEVLEYLYLGEIGTRAPRLGETLQYTWQEVCPWK